MSIQNEDMTTINIAVDYDVYPFGRYRKDGRFSATRFRDDILVPALQKHKHVKVIFDGLSDTVTSSFYSEIFKVLRQKEVFSAKELNEKLILVAEDQDIIDEVKSYIS